MTQEVLKLALEALEEINKLSIGENAICLPAEIDTAMDAIKEALAQEQEQEPVAMVESVATVVSESGNQEVTMSWWHEPALPVGTKLYTTPPQRKPLTSKEIRAIEVEVAMSNSFAHPTKAEEFVRAIEAAHGIKGDT